MVSRSHQPNSLDAVKPLTDFCRRVLVLQNTFCGTPTDSLRRVWRYVSLSDGVKAVSRFCDSAAQDVHLAGIADDFCPGADPLFTLLNRADQH